MDLVVLGLTLSSSWGNGHATTYRALLQGLSQLGHATTFLERDVPWYAHHRDLTNPSYSHLELYDSLDELRLRHGKAIQSADAVLIGSYVPEGTRVLDLVLELGPRVLAFYDIDTPITLAKLRQGDDEYIAPRQIPLLDLYFSFAGGPSLRRLEVEWAARRARPLYCSVEPEAYRPTGETPFWDLGYLGTYSADRQPALERLLLEPARRLPERRFVVAGSQYPPTVRWPPNVDRIEHLPPPEHASFYSRQRFTLNLTRSDMATAGWSPSVRLFEAGACGTAIVSDSWPGLEDFFPPGEAIVVAHTAEDVTNLLLRTPDARRADLARQARNIVLAEHTGAARAQELVLHLDEVLRDKRQPEALPRRAGSL